MVSYSWNLVSSLKILPSSFPAITFITNLPKVLSPAHVDYSGLSLVPPAPASAPIHQSQDCLFCFPGYSLPRVSSPGEFHWLLSLSRSKPLILIFVILQNVDSDLLMFLSWYYHFYHICLSPVNAIICSFICHPSNVELAHLFTLLASACQILPFLQGPLQMFLSCQKASPNTPRLSLPWQDPFFLSLSLFFSSDIIQLDALLSNVLNCPFNMSIHVPQIISS